MINTIIHWNTVGVVSLRVEGLVQVKCTHPEAIWDVSFFSITSWNWSLEIHMQVHRCMSSSKVQKADTSNTKVILAAPDDTIISCEASQSVHAIKSTLFTRVLSVIHSFCVCNFGQTPRAHVPSSELGSWSGNSEGRLAIVSHNRAVWKTFGKLGNKNNAIFCFFDSTLRVSATSAVHSKAQKCWKRVLPVALPAHARSDYLNFQNRGMHVTSPSRKAKRIIWQKDWM